MKISSTSIALGFSVIVIFSIYGHKSLVKDCAPWLKPGLVSVSLRCLSVPYGKIISAGQ